MYGKLFEQMYDGTLADNWQALITFQQMIILCDDSGIIDLTPSSISRRTGIPIEHIEAGIKALEDEDPYSRTPEEGGRRIVRLDDHRPWGWRIVNHQKYKQMASYEDKKRADRERIAAKREKEKSQPVATCRNLSLEVVNVAHTDTDTDTDNKTPCSPKSVNEYSDDFIEFWKHYPKKKNKGAAWKAWKKIKRPKETLALIQTALVWQKRTSQWVKDGGQFIPNPSTYLNAKGWEDEKDGCPAGKKSCEDWY